MSVFSSILRLPSRDTNNPEQETRELGQRDISRRLLQTPGRGTTNENYSLLRPAIVGAGIVGAAAGALYYSRTPGAATKIARQVSKWLKKDPTDIVRDGTGLYREQLVGTAQDILYMSNRIKDLNPKYVKEAVEELQATTTQHLQKGETQATIGDLLSQLNQANTDQSKKLAGELQGAISTIASKTRNQGLSADDIIRDLSLGQNIFREGGKIADYRGFTPGGMMSRGLEWAHENLKVPFMDFAPTDLFMHNSWAHTRRAIQVNPQDVVHGQRLESKGILVGSKIFLENGGKAEGNFNVFRRTSAVAESLDALRGNLKYKSIGHLLEEGDMDIISRNFLQALNKGKWAGAPKGLRQSLQNKLGTLKHQYESNSISIGDYNKGFKQLTKEVEEVSPGFENFFLSPKFSHHKSIWAEIMDWGKRITDGTASLTKTASGAAVRDLKEDPLSWIEQIKLKFRGDVRGLNYIDNSGEVIGKGVRGPKKSGGFENYVEGVHREEDIVTSFADYATNPKVPTEFTYGDAGKGLTDKVLTGETAQSFWHYLFQRPSRILEALTGFGIKPGESVASTAMRNTIGAYAALEAGRQGLAYLNFLGMGVPAKAAAAAGGAVQLGAQAAYTATGTGILAEQMEQTLPGSVDSFASQLGRIIAAPFAGAWLGGKFLPSEVDASKLQFWKQAGDQTAEAARSGGLSGRAAGALIASALAISTVWIDPQKGLQQQYQEITGEKRVGIKNARWWVAGRQPYEGDHIKYFDESWVQKMWNYDASMKTTYGSEGNAWSESWFPTPSNLFGIAPLMDPYATERRNFAYRPYPEISPVGGNVPVFGPLIENTIGQIVKPRITFDADQPEGYGRYGETSQEGELLGFETEVGEINARGAGDFGSMANKTVNQLQDLFGIYGFAQRTLMGGVFGVDTGFGTGYESEGSSQMTSQGRGLANLNLGGFMGTTEYFRRIYNERTNNTNYYNPMPNDMPGWLPGAGSIFPGDKNFKTDFHHGDPYTAIELGEVRLPGPGYEASRGYHGGDSPDAFDMWAILTDVAPGSDAQKYYGQQVTTAVESGAADAEAEAMYNRVMNEQNERRTGKYTFRDYTEPVVQDPGPMGQMTKDYLGFANVNIENAENINPVLKPVRDVWDTVTHTRIPGLAWAQGKFMHNRTPLEEYVATQVHGSEFADWASPVQGFIKPGLQEIRGSVQGANYIPHDVQKRWEVEEYYDKMKYLKARRLQSRAEELGQTQLARQYQQQQQQTVVGMSYDPGAVNKNIFKALSPSYRTFAAPFAKASPEEAQSIMPYLPNYQRNMWQNIWAGNKVMPGQVDTSDPQQRADEEVSEYFSQRALPEVDAPVWNPDVSLDEYKLRTAENEGVSYWQLGIPEAKAREFRSLGRTEVLLDTSPFLEDMETKQRLMDELHSSGNYKHKVSMSNVRQTQHIRYNGNHERNSRVNEYAGRF